jgi:hypothetical protein
MKKKIYIAGKVTGLPWEEVKARFAVKQHELEEAGHDVCNPCEMAEKNNWHSLPWGEIMRSCIAALMFADELHLLPRWQDSRGAILEHDTAQRVGIPIVYPTH